MRVTILPGTTTKSLASTSLEDCVSCARDHWLSPNPRTAFKLLAVNASTNITSGPDCIPCSEGRKTGPSPDAGEANASEVLEYWQSGESRQVTARTNFGVCWTAPRNHRENSTGKAKCGADFGC
eukprot:678007-Rhodomonas_salina.2